MEDKEQYLTYEEYKGLGGNLSEKPFNLQEFKARKIVDTYTFGRLINLKEQVKEVKMCMYELIRIVDKKDNSNNISSEKVGDYSINYSNSSEYDEEINNTIYSYLINCYLDNGTPYLYRGV